jgi:uncharacterized protein YlxP (DUF503 family)
MQTIKLTEEEAEVVRDVIAHVIGDMNVEVYRTDTHDFKEMLKHRRDVLEQVLTRLDHEHVPVL